MNEICSALEDDIRKITQVTLRVVDILACPLYLPFVFAAKLNQEKNYNDCLTVDIPPFFGWCILPQLPASHQWMVSKLQHAR